MALPASTLILQKQIEHYLTQFLREKVNNAVRLSPHLEEPLQAISQFVLNGGKRLRPLLLYYGYRAAGGELEEAILRCSISIELIHSYLLVHDDIMDQDLLRRHQPTLHSHFQQIHNSAAHGNSLGVVAGDLLASFGHQVLSESPFLATHKQAAQKCFADLLETVCQGQTLDLLISLQKEPATEAEVLQVATLKTAHYSFEGPLHLGAYLNGADSSLLSDLSAYALPLGIAFQIQDDILGSFGDPAETGKSATSDAQQAKYTLLICRAIKKGNSTQRQKIREIRQLPSLTTSDLTRLKELIQSTGALEYCQSRIQALTAQAREQLGKRKWPVEVAEFLHSLCDFLFTTTFQ